LLICTALVTTAYAARYDVTAYGAKGDGDTKDTAAIQKAVDACADAGGGEVFFPKGVFLSGSIILKSGVILFISPDAVMRGSTNIADYTKGALINAEDIEKTGIEGGGIIDGQGSAFWVKKEKTYSGRAWGASAMGNYIALKRPAFIHFKRCREITMRNIMLTNSPMWTVHLQRCTNVRADNVTIRNHLSGWNTDGFDINSCVDVRITGCDIITGDDAIVLKSSEPGYDHPSRDILAENCRIWTTCSGFKIGTETHDSFENIVFRNSVIYCASDDPLERSFAAIAITSVDGSRINGVTVSNIMISNVKSPFFVRLGHRGGNSERTRQAEPRVPGTIRNVLIADVTALRSMYESWIAGIPGHPVTGITLSNISLEYEGGGGADLPGKAVPDEAVITNMPVVQMFGRLPSYGLYCRHVDNISIHTISLRVLSADARPAFVCDDVKRISLNGFSAAPSTGEFPVAWFMNVRDAALRNCAAPSGTKVFLGAAADDDAFRTISLSGGMENGVTALAKLKPGPLLPADIPLFTEKDGAVFIKADRMKLFAPMGIVTDARAPAGNYIETPLTGGRDNGSAIARFELSSDGEYILRVLAFSPAGESDSFYVSFDGGPQALSDVLVKGTWYWEWARDRVNDKPVPESKMTYRLAKGEHMIKVLNREEGTRIAALVIMKKDGTVDPASLMR
ncbi:MAG: right-handed parallel beta-helix repeat-containing protein, partial [Spirochaetes bacterium]|nr:right-handed parallel beta-helix repeat-containing protein [Spirochaetota bacterium]